MIARPDQEIDHLRTNPAQYAPYPGSAFVINSRKRLETKERNGAPDRIRTCDLWFRSHRCMGNQQLTQSATKCY